MSRDLVAGIDLGGTKCSVSLGSLDGQVLASRRFPTPDAGSEQVLPAICSAVTALLDSQPTAALVATGVSSGGPLDSARGLIIAPPNLPGWRNVEIARLLEEELGAPSFLENDANACALAEWRLGAGRGTRNMVFCTMGTGFGAGLILAGRLYRGSHDLAGEIGHVRLTLDGPVGYGKSGSVEGYCGGSGIAQLARLRAREWRAAGRADRLGPVVDAITAKAVGDAAQRGDELALAIYREVGAMLGRSLAILVDILDPEVIVIGSIFARSEGLLRDAMERELHREALPDLRGVRVVPALLGESLGNVASVMVALEGLGNRRTGAAPPAATPEGR